MTGSSHPVRRQLDPAQFSNVCRSKIGNRFAHRHATRRRPVNQGQRRAFAHREGFTKKRVKAHRRHRDIGHRHLPRPHHLVARREAADAAVANGDQEILRRYTGQTQDAPCGFLEVDHLDVERRQIRLHSLGITMRSRCLAQQHFHRHVDRQIAEVIILDLQQTLFRRNAKHSKGAALAFTHAAKFVEPLWRYREHIALLRLVAPDFARRHAGFFTW